MDELLKLFQSMAQGPTGRPESSLEVTKELEAMQNKLKKMNSKLIEKLKRTKTTMLKVEELPKDTKKLLAAASIGDNSRCSHLLCTGTDVNSRGANNETALCAAASGGHTDLLKLLLQHKADVNVQDEDGDTPLILAVMAGKTAFIRAFLEHCEGRVDVNLKNKAGKTAIDKAFKAENEEAVTLLVKRGAHFECNEEKHKNMLFKHAIEGKVFFIQFWLQQHPRKEAVINMTRMSRTLSLVAALNGNLDLLKLLSTKGANLDLADEDDDTPMFCAAQNGFYQIVEFLISKGCDVNHKNKAGRTPIFSALMTGHIDIVRLLQSHGAILTVRDRDGNSLLNIAVGAGQNESFEYLCEHLPPDCLQFTTVNKDGETCLLESSQTKNLTIFRQILEKTTDLNHTNKKGVSAVLRAAFNNQLEMVKLLLERGAEPDIPNGGNETALLCAAQKDNLELLQLLLNTGKCNVSVEDSNGFTLVYRAVENKNVKMLRFLVESKAPVDIADVYGNTPFILAVNKNCIESVKILIEQGKVDMSRRNLKGHTAVLLAVNNESEEMLRYLLLQGCERDVSDESGDTPLLLSIKKKNYRLAKLLLRQVEMECDASIADKKGISCAHAAAFADNSACITLLTSMGANLEQTDSQGNTPLAVAVKHKNTTALIVLQANGADVNRRNAKGQNMVNLSASPGLNYIVALKALGCSLDTEDFNGNSPLHVASAEGESLAIDFLIEQGVAINLQNKDGDTPVHLACKAGSNDALNCLLEHNATLKVRNNMRQTELMLACKSGGEKLIDMLLKHYNQEAVNLQDVRGKTALHYAIDSENDGAAKLLIQAGANVNCLDNDGFTPALYAAKMCRWSILTSAIQCGIDFEKKSKNAESAAHFAAAGAHLQTLKKLKEMSAPLNELTLEGNSCLILAASASKSESDLEEIFDFLLSEGNHLNHCNENGENAICKAAQVNNLELFFYLASKRADFLIKDKKGNSGLHYLLDRQEKQENAALIELVKEFSEEELSNINAEGYSLCHIAAQKDYLKLLRSLRDRGMDLGRATASEETCITLAAKSSNSETLEFLLELIRSQEPSQATQRSEQDEANRQAKLKRELERALRIRAEHGKKDLMAELLNSNIDVNAEDDEGNTALIVCCQKKQQDFAIHLLSFMEKSALDVNKVNRNGFSALHYACKNQLTACVEQLLSCGARKDFVNSDGFMCLHEAVRGADSTEVADLLIDSGCDVNATTADGDNCLTLALKRGNKFLTQLLIKRGATLDTNKISIPNAIKMLLSKGRRDLVMWIVNQGADVNQIDAGSRPILFDVIKHGAAEILQFFIDKGANVECEDVHGLTPFLFAIQSGREDLAKILLDRGCNTRKCLPDGRDCVMIAASSKRLFTLKWLFANIPELDSAPHVAVKGRTALHLCGKTGHQQMFDLLLTKGYDLEKECERRWTPVDYSIAKGHLGILKAVEKKHRGFFTQRIQVLLNRPTDLPSPLAAAAAKGYENVFKFLISKGIDFEKLSAVIPAACAKGQQHIVEYLHSVGVDVNSFRRSTSEKTAVLLAIDSGNLHLVRYLIEDLKCDFKAVCYNKNTAVQGAVTTNQERMLNYLIQNSAPVDEPDAKGDTPLLKAALECQQRMLEILLDHNCIMQRRNNKNRNAIHMAVIKKDMPEFVKFLMDKGVQADAKDERGNTACMIASYQGHTKTVKFFLEHERRLGNERNFDGSTPALLAAMKGRKEVLQILAANSCLAMDDADNDGTTILMLAIHSGSVETVKLLLEIGGCDLTAVNNNGIGVQTVAQNCRNEEMRRLLVEHCILSEPLTQIDQESRQEAEANLAESPEIRIGHPIKLLVFTPDIRAEALEEVASDNEFEDGSSASQSGIRSSSRSRTDNISHSSSERSTQSSATSTYISVLSSMRHAPVEASERSSRTGPGSTATAE